MHLIKRIFPTSYYGNTLLKDSLHIGSDALRISCNPYSTFRREFVITLPIPVCCYTPFNHFFIFCLTLISFIANILILCLFIHFLTIFTLFVSLSPRIFQLPIIFYQGLVYHQSVELHLLLELYNVICYLFSTLRLISRG